MEGGWLKEDWVTVTGIRICSLPLRLDPIGRFVLMDNGAP